MGGGVDAAGHATHDHEAGRPQEMAQLLGDLQPVGAWTPRPDDRQGLRHGQPPNDFSAPAAVERSRGVLVQIEQGFRIAGLAATQPPNVARRAAHSAPLRRRLMARATCSAWIRSEPARSAMVRETLSTRSWPLPLSWSWACPCARVRRAPRVSPAADRSWARSMSALQRPGPSRRSWRSRAAITRALTPAESAVARAPIC